MKLSFLISMLLMFTFISLAAEIGVPKDKTKIEVCEASQNLDVVSAINLDVNSLTFEAYDTQSIVLENKSCNKVIALNDNADGAIKLTRNRYLENQLEVRLE